MIERTAIEAHFNCTFETAYVCSMLRKPCKAFSYPSMTTPRPALSTSPI